MQYEVHWSYFDDPHKDKGQLVGIEIQPPLSERAVNGIISKLVKMRQGPGEVIQHGHVADEVAITRQDEVGTAMVISPQARRSPMGIALTIGRLIDPCNIHDVHFDPPVENLKSE